MRIILLACFCFAALACSTVQTASLGNPSPAPTVDAAQPKPVDLKPVTPNVDLNREQKRELDAALPQKVREILEKSSRFEIVAEIDADESSEVDVRDLNPNRIAVITEDRLKKEILESFYVDVSAGPRPTACYEPHHGIKAEYNGQKVEVDICFSCSRIVVKSPFGEFNGGIAPFGERRSEILFQRIVSEKSVELKK